jgi:hypothetical protein
MGYIGSLKRKKILRTVVLGNIYILLPEARGGAMVEALRYKPEGRGIDSQWCQHNFSLT